MENGRITSYNVCYTKLLRYPTLIVGYINDLDSEIVISNNIFKAEWSGLINNGFAIYQGTYGDKAKVYVYNNIFYNRNNFV